MGFDEEEYFFLETDGGVEIPVVRRGNLSIESSFYCLLQNTSSSNFSSATTGEDYISSRTLHVLTFDSGQDTSYCYLHIADDTHREGTQVLQIVLLPATVDIERHVRFHNRSAIIHILDKEDGEYVCTYVRSLSCHLHPYIAYFARCCVCLCVYMVTGISASRGDNHIWTIFQVCVQTAHCVVCTKAHTWTRTHIPYTHKGICSGCIPQCQVCGYRMSRLCPYSLCQLSNPMPHIVSLLTSFCLLS